MNSWIEVDAENLVPPQTEKIRGVEVQVFVAPHDVPRRVRGKFEELCGIFAIELQYLDDEPFKFAEQNGDGSVKFFSGVTSGRLRRIEVDVRKTGAQQIRLQVDEAVQLVEDELDSVGKNQRRLETRLNYQAAREALEVSKVQLAYA